VDAVLVALFAWGGWVPDGTPAAFALPSGRRLVRAVDELLLAGLLAAMATLCHAVLLAGTVVLLVRHWWPRWATPLARLIPALVNTMALSTVLIGTRTTSVASSSTSISAPNTG
jgi:hypothetical protein